MNKNKKLSFIAFVILGLILVGCGSDSSSPKDSTESDEVKITGEEDNSSFELNLPTVSNKSSSKLMQKAENEIIKSAVSRLSFGYYRDEGKEQWYISHVNLSTKTNVYSLTPFRDGKNGWGTVGKNVASFDSKAESVKIDFIADNNEYRYYDEGWNDWNVDPMIQEHILKIRNDNVNIEWWFFQATNGSWYIVNKAGKILKFSSKDGAYDWIEIDMNGAKPTFFIEGGEKKMKFGSTTITPKIISTFYDRDSKTVYLLASSEVHSPSVYFAGKHAITNNCLGNNEYVYSMNFKALTDVNTNVKGELELEARRKGIAGITLTGGGSSSSSYQTPAVYYFNWDAPLTKQVHYNVVGISSGKAYSSGWRPDDGGGCTYTPNPLK